MLLHHLKHYLIGHLVLVLLLLQVGSIDHITFTEGMRVLVKNRPGDLYNNIYIVDIIGDAENPAELKEVEGFNSLDAGIFVLLNRDLLIRIQDGLYHRLILLKRNVFGHNSVVQVLKP